MTGQKTKGRTANIQDELNWDTTFEKTQEQLSTLAWEAIQEYDAGNTSDKDW